VISPARLTTALLSLCAALLAAQSAATSKSNLDIQASAEYSDFIRAVAAQTALAETRPGDFVKFFWLGKNESGEVVVMGISLLPIDAHAEAELEKGRQVFAIAHVHHRRMNQAPVKEDALTVRGLGVPNFVIGADGQSVWEVGIVGGQDMYREVGLKNPGKWKALE
jgi:hypothetical protein